LKFPFIAISAGVRGCQILLDPKHLFKAVGAQTGPISRSD
jgi:prolyl-tRNA editing enzyme YbaK/EbsC (Cys-tRNA(Pro) deacylase)